jgi:hypothetical protein
MKIVGYYSFRGGAGSTTFASNTCIHAAERGLAVIGATLGFRHDLRHHLAHADVPWCDGLEGLPSHCDLLVLDVHWHSELTHVVRPDLWVMSIPDRTAVDNAARILPQLVGPALWVPTRGIRSGLVRVPDEFKDRVSISPPIPYSDVFYDCYNMQRPAWAASPGSTAALAMVRHVEDVLARVGLAAACGSVQRRTYHGESTFDHHSYRGYLAHQQAAQSRLRDYFDHIRPTP